MKTLFVSLFVLSISNVAAAAANAGAFANHDGLGIAALLVVGMAGLVIARRKTT